MEIDFEVKLDWPHHDDYLFFVIEKSSLNGKIIPVYRSENEKEKEKKILWQRVKMDTDTLADANPQTELCFKFYEFSPKG